MIKFINLIFVTILGFLPTIQNANNAYSVQPNSNIDIAFFGDSLTYGWINGLSGIGPYSYMGFRGNLLQDIVKNGTINTNEQGYPQVSYDSHPVRFIGLSQYNNSMGSVDQEPLCSLALSNQSEQAKKYLICKNVQQYGWHTATAGQAAITRNNIFTNTSLSATLDSVISKIGTWQQAYIKLFETTKDPYCWKNSGINNATNNALCNGIKSNDYVFPTLLIGTNDDVAMALAIENGANTNGCGFYMLPNETTPIQNRQRPCELDLTLHNNALHYRYYYPNQYRHNTSNSVPKWHMVDTNNSNIAPYISELERTYNTEKVVNLLVDMPAWNGTEVHADLIITAITGNTSGAYMNIDTATQRLEHAILNIDGLNKNNDTDFNQSIIGKLITIFQKGANIPYNHMAILIQAIPQAQIWDHLLNKVTDKTVDFNQQVIKSEDNYLQQTITAYNKLIVTKNLLLPKIYYIDQSHIKTPRQSPDSQIPTHSSVHPTYYQDRVMACNIWENGEYGKDTGNKKKNEPFSCDNPQGGLSQAINALFKIQTK